jgi:hypothetical protein
MPPISPLFQFHKLNPEGIKNAELIAESFDSLLLYLSKLCPDSREFSIAKTKLEEASFFSKKAMANLPENQATE